MSPVYVEVCSACKRACCWQGEFMCEEARSASTRLIDVKVLRELALEHPSWWEKKPVSAEPQVSCYECGGAGWRYPAAVAIPDQPMAVVFSMCLECGGTGTVPAEAEEGERGA